MGAVSKSVRVEPELLEQLDRLARQRLIPETFTGQVDAALRLLVDQVTERQARRSAQLVAADRDRAQATYRRLQPRSSS